MRTRAKTLAKHLAWQVLGNPKRLSDRIKRVTAAGQMPVLNFHRVSDDRSSSYGAVSPAVFEDFVSWLQERFTLTTFRGLEDEPHSEKPAAILSFDDGYRDFLETVDPILRKANIAANLNIVPQIVDTGLPPLNVLLQDFIGQAPRTLLIETPLPGTSDAQRVNETRSVLGQRASAALKSEPIALQAKTFETIRPFIKRLDDFRSTPVLNLDELREAAERHEIGAHSHEHATMTSETDEYLDADLVKCRTWFVDNLGQNPSVYAFPNGNARPGQIEVVHDAGYRHVLLVGEDFSRPGAVMHNRFTMYGTSRSELAARALGGT